MRKMWMAMFVVVCIFTVASGTPAQDQKAPAKGPLAKTQQEYDAYKKFQSETDWSKKAADGEQFMKDYPDSALTGSFLLPMLVQAYEQLGNFPKTVTYAEKALQSEQSKTTLQFLYQTLVVSYQQLNNYEKTVEYGEKMLVDDPNNTFALFVLSGVIPERIKDDDMDRQQKLDRTTTYAKRLLETTNAMQRPPQMTDDQWKQQRGQLLGGAYSSLGFVALHQKDYDEAIKQYKQSIDLYPKDPIAFYRLGLAYSFNKKNDEAIKALAASVAMNGPDQARSYLEQIYRAKNNGSLDGLDKVISDAKAQLKN
ncbi:MAG: tetratricopeptide repeat protein [Acidobacteriia bacterium]|nr:tetratricopeptide repeat protein [Terriglobia bacterium]